MKPTVLTIAMILGILSLCLSMVYSIIDTQEQHGAQLFNQYWPFTVEMQVRDR